MQDTYKNYPSVYPLCTGYRSKHLAPCIGQTSQNPPAHCSTFPVCGLFLKNLCAVQIHQKQDVSCFLAQSNWTRAIHKRTGARPFVESYTSSIQLHMWLHSCEHKEWRGHWRNTIRSLIIGFQHCPFYTRSLSWRLGCVTARITLRWRSEKQSPITLWRSFWKILNKQNPTNNKPETRVKRLSHQHVFLTWHSSWVSGTCAKCP